MAATTTETKKKMVTLRSSDGEEFEIEEAVAMQSQTIRHLIEDECADSGIPLPNVDGRILSKVIEYCKKHVDSSSSSNEYWHDDKVVDDELKAWDTDFIKVDQNTLFDVILKSQSMAATTTETKKKMVTLRRSDGEEFEIEKAVAMQSQTIRHLIEDECADSGIPLPNVDGRILSKVTEYCKKHVDSSSSSNEYWHDDKVVDDELKAWDSDFIKVDQNTLFDVILAANYLDIKSLLDLTCKAVADMMRGKTPEEIRKTFHIKNDYTPEEEEEVRRENQWAFE